MPGNRENARPSIPRVALVVVTYNSASVVADFLASLPAAMEGLDWTLVVADNASTDATLDLTRASAPTARVVEVGSNAGYAAGINAAIAGFGSLEELDALIVANPDVRLDPGCGSRLVSPLAISRRSETAGSHRSETAGITAPRIRNTAGLLSYTLRRDPTVSRALGEAILGGTRAGRVGWLGETDTRRSSYEHGHDVDWASGAVLCISASCARAVGKWDETFWLYSEETDFCLRARELGFSVRYVPEAGAVHLEGDANSNPFLWTTLCVNRVRHFARHHGRFHAAAYRAAVLANEAIRALGGRKTSRAALAGLMSASPELTSQREVVQDPSPSAR